MQIIIGNKFKVERKLASGSFGEIYQGLNLMTKEPVAIKLESLDSKHPQLLYESQIYKIFKNGIGICPIYWSGVEGEYNVLIMELLGPSLEDIFNDCERKFSLKTILMLTDQILQRIEFIHNKYFLHRDLKPNNLLIGRGKNQKIIHLMDFGLSKRYKDLKTYEHIPFKEGVSLVGNTTYASIHTHLGYEQGRRDDLESIGYLMSYFLRSNLPWQGIDHNKSNKKYSRIKEMKTSISFDELLKGFPDEFVSFLEYSHSLKFEEAPNYNFLRKLLKDVAIKKKIEFDFEFDWIIKKNKIISIMSKINEEVNNFHKHSNNNKNYTNNKFNYKNYNNNNNNKNLINHKNEDKRAERGESKPKFTKINESRNNGIKFMKSLNLNNFSLQSNPKTATIQKFTLNFNL